MKRFTCELRDQETFTDNSRSYEWQKHSAQIKGWEWHLCDKHVDNSRKWVWGFRKCKNPVLLSYYGIRKSRQSYVLIVYQFSVWWIKRGFSFWAGCAASLRPGWYYGLYWVTVSMEIWICDALWTLARMRTEGFYGLP